MLPGILVCSGKVGEQTAGQIILSCFRFLCPDTGRLALHWALNEKQQSRNKRFISLLQSNLMYRKREMSNCCRIIIQSICAFYSPYINKWDRVGGRVANSPDISGLSQLNDAWSRRSIKPLKIPLAVFYYYSTQTNKLHFNSQPTQKKSSKRYKDLNIT